MKALFKGIGDLLLLCAVVYVFVMLYGCVFIILWMWFAVPVSGVTLEAVLVTIAIVIAIDYLAKQGLSRLFKNKDDTWSRLFFEASIRPATVLLVAFFIKLQQ